MSISCYEDEKKEDEDEDEDEDDVADDGDLGSLHLPIILPILYLYCTSPKHPYEGILCLQETKTHDPRWPESVVTRTLALLPVNVHKYTPAYRKEVDHPPSRSTLDAS